MKKYKIGEVSKMLNIPPETIRSLERMGLLSPGKKEGSNYRFYDLQDISQILNYKKYRQMGFSSAESIRFLTEGSQTELLQMLEEKQQEAERLSRHYRSKAEKLCSLRDMAASCETMVGRFYLLWRPESYALFMHSRKDEEVRFADADRIEESMQELMENAPFVERFYCIRQSWFEDGRSGREYLWGFLLRKYWAEQLGIQIGPQMQPVERPPCLFTVIPIREREDGAHFSAEQLDEAFEYMQGHGYRLNGDVYGVYVATLTEQQERVHYVQCWIPVAPLDPRERMLDWRELPPDLLEPL